MNNINTLLKHDIKRISIVTGHFGSGKTEFSLNLALSLKELGKDVVIVYFDVVNPYFRTKDAESFLIKNGIDVISPEFANMNIENPYLPPDILRVFTDKSKYVIFDVGGDEDGATPLGMYHSYFEKEDYDLYFVLNERRLLTGDVESAKQVLGDIIYVSRLKPTKVVSNTHLMNFTDPDVMLNGIKLCEQFSKETNIEFSYILGTEKELDDFKNSENYHNKYDDMLFKINLFVGPHFN